LIDNNRSISAGGSGVRMTNNPPNMATGKIKYFARAMEYIRGMLFVD